MSSTTNRVYDWYDLVEDPADLAQGDLIDSLPVAFPHPFTESFEPVETSAEAIVYDLIVMTQSCDLAQDKVDLILLCPVYNLDIYLDERKLAGTSKAKTKAKNRLRNGDIIGYHLLNQCELPEHVRDYLVVDLKNPISLQKEYILHHLESHSTRLRLLPPYREHLSQAFARTFMRVGLPIGIPEFK